MANTKQPKYQIGDTVGDFTFIRTQMHGKNCTWVMKCVCGEEKKFWKHSAIFKNKTCGCCTDATGLTGSQRRSMLSRLNSYKSGAKKRGLEWGLSTLEFLKIATLDCAYCGSPPKTWDCVSGAPSVQKDCPRIDPQKYEIRFNGIDRIDSRLGYVFGNVAPCCSKCNRAKNDMTVDDFRNHVTKMYLWMLKK